MSDAMRDETYDAVDLLLDFAKAVDEGEVTIAAMMDALPQAIETGHATVRIALSMACIAMDKAFPYACCEPPPPTSPSP